MENRCSNCKFWKRITFEGKLLTSGSCHRNGCVTQEYRVCSNYESNLNSTFIGIFITPKKEIFTDDNIHAWLDGGEDEA